MDIDLKLFYERIHAPYGFRAFTTKYSANSRAMHCHWAASTDEALSKYAELLSSNDVYHTCHVFSKPDRKKDAALRFKCVVGDFDFRPGEKGHKTLEEFLTAFQRVEARMGYKPIIIFSGSGCHTYFQFKEAEERHVWESETRRFLDIVREEKVLGCDTQVSVDLARVLRVPGTMHYKHKRRVECIQWSDELHTPKYIKPEVREADNAAVELQNKRYAKVELDTLIDTCGHIAYLLSGEPGQTYESWFGCGSVLRHMPGGEEIFKEASQLSRDDGYEQAALKLPTYTQEAQVCGTFEPMSSHGSFLPCATCRFRGKGSNPLDIALEVAKSKTPNIDGNDGEPTEEDWLPHGYIMQGRRIMFNKKGPDGTGAPVCVSDNPVYVDSVFKDPNRDMLVSFRFRDMDGEWDNVLLDHHDAISHNGLKALTKKVNAKPELFRMYASDAISHFQTRKELQGKDVTMPLATYFGWSKFKKDKEPVFLLGRDAIVRGDEARYTTINSADEGMKQLAEYLTCPFEEHEKERAYEEWYNLASDFLEDGTMHLGPKVAYAAALVSPLFFIGGEYRAEKSMGGIFINCWGESGLGKTLGQQIGASLYGKPGGRGKGLLLGDITYAAAWLAIEKSRHLPFYLDEFTNNPLGRDSQTADNFVKAISRGKSPERATSDGKARPVFNFDLAVISSSNQSVVDLIGADVDERAATAAAVRMLEFHIPGTSTDAHDQGSKYDRFQSLFGLGGRRWLKHLCQKETLARLYKHLDEYSLGGFKNDARYIRTFIMYLDFVVKEMDNCLLPIFEPGFMDQFIESQRETLEMAERRRGLTPTQQAVLAFIGQHKDKSLEYKKVPNGKCPVPERKPIDTLARAYQDRTVEYIYVMEPDPVILIPQEKFKKFYKPLMKTRNLTSELHNLVASGFMKAYDGVLLHGNQDQAKVPCYGFRQETILTWQYLASDIVQGSQASTDE